MARIFFHCRNCDNKFSVEETSLHRNQTHEVVSCGQCNPSGP